MKSISSLFQHIFISRTRIPQLLLVRETERKTQRDEMYKTKLQELCHQGKWGLPRYSAMKDGPDHNPCFKASVAVNGLSFDSPVSCKSSKIAQNDAAKLAFLHFTNPSPTPNSSLSSTGTSNGESAMEETLQQPDVQSHKLDIKDDSHCHYKSKLLNYARKKNCDLPVYSSTNEGPSHAPRFKATVTIDGQTFESPEFVKTLKEAKQVAAKAAMISLLTDCSQEDNVGFYKNLLQELAQREGLSIPIYKTIKSGAPHMPTFFSSVEVEGETFYGKAGKSKKDAEKKAATVAYTVLKERALSRSSDLASPTVLADETLRSTPDSDLTKAVDLQQNPKQKGQWLSSPAIMNEEYSAEDEGQKLNLAVMVSPNLQSGSEDSILSPAVSAMDRVIGHQHLSSYSESFDTFSKEGAMSRSAELTSPVLVADETLNITAIPGLDLTIAADSQQNLKYGGHLLLSPAITGHKYIAKSEVADEVQEENLAETLSASPKSGSNTNLSSAVSFVDKSTGYQDSSSCSEFVPTLSKEGPSSSTTRMDPGIYAPLISGSHLGNAMGIRSYLLCERVRVYTYYPDIDFPKGIMVLPISDNQWVAVSLELPDDQVY